MAEMIAATELSKRLSDVLSRVQDRGEIFQIMRNGEPVAKIVPPGGAPERNAGSWRAFVQRVRDLPLDPSFADDLEAAQRMWQGPVPLTEWPSS